MPRIDPEGRRDYGREYRMANKQKMKAAQVAYAARMRELISAWKYRPCMDCGGWFEACQMDFDHRPGTVKLFQIGDRGISFFDRERLITEVKKCDVVCANCHRLRTHRRNQNASAINRSIAR